MSLRGRLHSEPWELWTTPHSSSSKYFFPAISWMVHNELPLLSSVHYSGYWFMVIANKHSELSFCESGLLSSLWAVRIVCILSWMLVQKLKVWQAWSVEHIQKKWTCKVWVTYTHITRLKKEASYLASCLFAFLNSYFCKRSAKNVLYFLIIIIASKYRFQMNSTPSNKDSL